MNDLIGAVDGFFLWIARNYRNEFYMVGTRLGVAVCCFADIATIWMILRIRDEIHGKISRRCYRILLVFAVLSPALFLVDGSIFFPLLGLVLGAPYLILIWAAVAMAPHLLDHMRKILRDFGDDR